MYLNLCFFVVFRVIFRSRRDNLGPLVYIIYAYYLCLDRASLIATSYRARTVLKVLQSLPYRKSSQLESIIWVWLPVSFRFAVSFRFRFTVSVPGFIAGRLMGVFMWWYGHSTVVN